MANVSIELTHDSNEFELNKHTYTDELYSTFEQKWSNIINKFEGKFLNDGYIIAPPDGVNIDTSSFSTLDDDQPNFDRSVCKFLGRIVNGGFDFSTGQEGFPEEFYYDLYRILLYYGELINYGYNDPVPDDIHKKIDSELNKDLKTHIDGWWGFFCGNANVIGEEGYYSLTINFTPKGFSVSNDFYEEDSDDIW